jgi:hypothetical protein
MRISFQPRRAALIAGLAAVVVLSGCGAFKSETPAQVVQRRAGERWADMRADKFAEAYQFNLPSYRKLRSEQQWRSNFGPANAWNSVDVLKVTCESDIKCTARGEIGVTVLAPSFIGRKIKTAVSETWLREAGNWYIEQSL